MKLRCSLLFTFSLCLAACSSTPDYRPVRTTFFTTPPGATLELDGTAIGSTPCTFTLPDKDSVSVRLTKPGYWSIEETIQRDPVDEDAPAGVGWFTTYSYPLRRKRP